MKKFEQQLLKNILKENVGTDDEQKVTSEDKPTVVCKLFNECTQRWLGRVWI